MTVEEAYAVIEQHLEELKQAEANSEDLIVANLTKDAGLAAERRNVEMTFHKEKLSYEHTIADLKEQKALEEAKLDELKHQVMDLGSKKAKLLTDNARLSKENSDFITYEAGARRVLDNQDQVLVEREQKVKEQEMMLGNKQSFLNR